MGRTAETVGEHEAGEDRRRDGLGRFMSWGRRWRWWGGICLEGLKS